MKALTTYINEKLILNKDMFKEHYFPKTKKELQDILKQLLEERKDDDVIDLNDIDTFNITDMSELFFQNKNIKKIDISDWDVSKVHNMSNMFCFCTELESIGDISRWNVSNVKNMRYMFYTCYELKSVGDISSWNISNTENIDNMFTNSGITNIPDWYEK